MAEAIRWKNCYGDVVSSKNGWMAQSLLDDVIEPGLDALDAQVSKLEESEDEALVIFLKSDLDHLHHAVAMGYCLSIQALWERQIRTYLRWCAKELAPEAMTRTEKSTWGEIEKLFRELRGISLSGFAEYPDLQLLHLLGNVCRHGEGASLRTLWEKHPELWPGRLAPEPPPGWQFSPTVEGIGISRGLLRRLAGAVVSFWEEAACIYMENLQSYDPGARARLDELKVMRSGRRARLI